MRSNHKNPVLFLDIDGVLCTRRAHLTLGKRQGIWYMWDPVGVDAVRQACEAGAKICVSSTWRFHPEDLFKQLDAHDLRKYLLDDWKTIDLRCNGKWRGDEIAEYLSRYPEIDSYRILDDDIDMLDNQFKKHIKTDTEEGMSSDNIKDLFSWIGITKD